MERIKRFFDDIPSKDYEIKLLDCIGALNNIVSDDNGIHLMRKDLYYMLTDDLKQYYLAKEVAADELPLGVTRVLHLSKKSDTVKSTTYDIRDYLTKEHIGIIEIKHELLRMHNKHI